MSIFEKIKVFFVNLFKKDDVKSISESSSESVEKTTSSSSSDFLESIKVKDNSHILSLQKKLLSNELKIENLSDEELNDMIVLYKNKLGKVS